MATLSIASNLTANPGDSIVIPVNIDDATGLEAIDLKVNYDTSLLDLTAVTAGSLTGEFTITPNIDDANGTARVVGFGITAIPNGSGSVVKLNFTVPSGASTGSNIVLDLVSASINEVAVTSLNDGNLTIGTISANVTLAVSPSSVTEDGTTNLIYTFTRTGSTTSVLTVNYDIAGTSDSSDYTGATSETGKTITFAAGASTATLTINPTADTIIESDETMALTLATGTSYTVGTTTAVTGTITNDDSTAVTLKNTTQTIAENTSTATRIKVADIDITDDGLGNNTITLVGADASNFEVEGKVLYLKANTVLNYENKDSYDVTVNVDDSTVGNTPDVSTNFTLKVTDINEAPTAVTLKNTTQTIAENTSTATRIKVADIDITDDGLGNNTITLDGADASNFEVEGKVLYLKANTVLNYESKNSYDVKVNVDDSTVGNTPDVFTNFTLKVADVNEAPTAVTLKNTTQTIAENTSTATRIKVADIDITDDGLGNNTITLDGADASNFEVEGKVLYLKANTVLNYESKNSYDVKVNVDDSTVGNTPDVFTNFTLKVADVNAPVITTPTTFSIPENTKSVGKVNAEDPEKDAITFALAGIDASLLAINTTTGELSFKTAPDFEKPLDNEKKNLYKTQVEVKDANNNQAIQDIIIKVTNVNETPIAIDDQLSIIQGSFGTINPLINDSDPDGDTLEITSKTDGKYGKVDINSNNLTYTLLDAKYTGEDVFNYTISDKNGLESTAKVNVTIAGKNITKETSQVTSINPGNSLFPREAGTQTGIVDKVSYSFSTNYNQSTGKQTLENTLKQTSAAFTNLFGLYEIDDATGAVNGILPGQSGYAKAALSKVVSNFVVRAGGSGNGVTGDVIVSGDKTYAPFVIANGGKSSGNIQEAINAFFGANPNNSAATAQNYTSLPVAYFSFGAANPDGAAHIKSLGNNIFGFEDLPAGVGVSDYDFNDTVFSFGF
ncbi:MAG: cadherin-like domain-containing protein [Aphanizomenon flos-aquae KM1D3_PB]|uniref:beta strand repeat-containing protein n=1 Tax=Aphanizomenon flos-aquae TaxID=1176 RepID=UPI00054219A9|nr:Ig-like domain-containing protein [Aphanizomenon flos-aquae]KHG41177.1 hypothetical protein OA07_12915 [Aphanizomenon flos-aquae 2012/KM1/D3]QSV70255.1 MAG: cadherin-like domain-containing protein [Aphanizomenon flos-aquae KM1D3_PB]